MSTGDTIIRWTAAQLAAQKERREFFEQNPEDLGCIFFASRGRGPEVDSTRFRENEDGDRLYVETGRSGAISGSGLDLEAAERLAKSLAKWVRRERIKGP